MQRRDWIKVAASSAAFGMGNMLSGFSLAQSNAETNGTKQLLGTDYRALVCVFLYGGNDAFNMVVPRSVSDHAIYAATRGGLAIDRNTLLPMTPTVAFSDGAQYGFHPSCVGLNQLFNDGRCALVANCGPLIKPLTQAQYQSGSVVAPSQLFSHADQQVLWQVPAANDTRRLGWGGKLADRFQASNINQQLSMNMTTEGENVFQAANNVRPYALSPVGVDDIWPIDPAFSSTRRAVFDQLMNRSYPNRMRDEIAQRIRRAQNLSATLKTALAQVPGNSAPFNSFDENNFLAYQLKMVARIIALRNTLQMRRQIFFVGLPGFDTHDNQLSAHNGLLGALSSGIKTFYDALSTLNIASGVTLFTASDFGRTLSINGDGTDHGWGAHHLVVGGAVNGGRAYGRMPSLLKLNNPDDAGYGQIIPTTSVDQYAATLAQWFGVPAAELVNVFPNINEFAPNVIGFV